MTWLVFIAVALAVFRLTWLLTKDKITAAFRREAKERGGKEVGYLVNCPWCASFYVSTLAVLYLVWVGMFNWKGIPLWLPAIWGLAMVINQIVIRITE